MRSFEKIKEYLQGTAARRAIASVLVAAECLSVVAVGMPAVYADTPVTTETLETVELADRTVNAAPEQETVTPAEAARLGAETAEGFANEAERAAEEAEQAADETDRILTEALSDAVLDAARERAGQAEDAARRALDAAVNAADEADWAAQAVEIAAQEASRTAEEAQRTAEEAERAARTAEETAEAARMLEEAAKAAEERDREREGSEQLQEAAEERTAKREEARDKITLASPTPAKESTETTDKTEKPENTLILTPDGEKKDAEQKDGEQNAAEQKDEDAEAPARMMDELAETSETAEAKAEEAARAREYASVMADEYDRTYASALQASEQANRAFAASDRAARASARAAAALAEAEAQYAQMPHEEPAQQPDDAANTENAENAENTANAENTENAENTANAENAENADSTENTDNTDYIDYTDSAVAVWGEVPAGVYVVTEDVSARYQGFDPREAKTLTTGETNSFLSDGSGAEKHYSVLAAYDISLSLNGEEYQPEPGSPLTVTITNSAIEEGMPLEIWHIHDDGFTEPVTDFSVEGNTVRFIAESFSVYLVCTYTVDFHFGDYTYSIAGESEITLSELLNKLGVTEITTANVANVSFSNPDYIAIEQTGSDWLLRSLAPFDTDEALTLTLNNGQNVEIKVTDADGEPQPEEPPEPIISAVPTEVRGLVYDGTAHQLINAGTVENGTMVYSLTKDGEYKTEIPQGINAGEYTVYYKIDGDEGAADSVTVSIAKVETSVTVTITEHSALVDYDGKEHTVTGYDVSSEGGLYKADDCSFSGNASVSGTNAGSYPMGLKAEDFTNTSGNFENVSFVIVDGTLTINPVAVTVTVTGHSETVVYDGKEHTVTGYDVSSEGGLYKADDCSFSGTASVSGTNAGSYPMELKAMDFTNTSGNFANVTFQTVAGTLTVNPQGVTLTANGATYQESETGEEITVNGYTCSVSVPELTFEGVSASGSGTVPGVYDVTFKGVTLNETRDTTGNYVVTATQNGLLIIVEKDKATDDIIQKEFKGINGDLASYEIVVNPNGLILGGEQGRDLTLKDTFSTNQSIIYNTVKIQADSATFEGNDPSFDYSGYTGTYTIPDGTPVTITYTTRVKGNVGDTVDISNTATLGRVTNQDYAVGPSDTVNARVTITPTGSDISGTGGVYSIELFAYAEGHMELGLEGAVFRLLDSNMRPMYYAAGDNKGQPITFTTGSNGYVTITLSDEKDGLSIHKNTVYFLEMITAPYATVGGEYVYYQKDNTYYSFLITDEPDYTYGNIYSYFNGDVLKVRCYPEAKGVNITKRFSGNYTLTKAQQNAIRFILQKQALDIESGWVDVESHSYSEFSYGSMNFNIGKTGGPELEDNATYRVIEENVLPKELEGIIEENVAVTVTYQRDGMPVEEETNEFFIDPNDKLAFSYNLAFTDEYIDHKLTIIKIDVNSGKALPDAEFTVFPALGGEALATYTTDAGGGITIRRNDAVAQYEADTLYYVVETKEPDTYILPADPEKVFFYFSENSSGVPAGLPSGAAATDLTNSYNTVTIENDSLSVDVPVTVVWGVNGSDPWPDEVDHVVIALYKSVGGGEAVPVPETPEIALTKDQYYDAKSFHDLPALEDGKTIAYSVVEKGIYGVGESITEHYARSSSISGTGWYVVKNEPAVSVTIQKEWVDQEGDPIGNTDGKPEVSFDLYRTTAESTLSDFTRAQLLALLTNAERVRTGLKLSADNGWSLTVDSLEKMYSQEKQYYYYAVEDVPDNQEDSYIVAAASESGLRTLTIKNKQTPITVTIRTDNLEKTYGDEDPTFTFENSDVMEEGAFVSVTGPDDEGYYSAQVTAADDTEKTLKFTASRKAGENVGTYVITPTGNEEQEGYRVLYETGTLTINQAEVRVTAGAEKTYGAEDPELVSVEGLKGEDTISFSVSREEGEDVGEYPITLEGDTDQGNYKVEYVREDSEGVPYVFRITRAHAIVTPTDATKIYGEEDPEFTATVSGLQFDDEPSVISYDLTRTPGEDVGKYTITAVGEPEQENYYVTWSTGEFTITAAALTLEMENAEKIYGDEDPEWMVTIDGLQRGEDKGELSSVLNEETGVRTYTYSVPKEEDKVPLFSFTAVREAGEDVGDYTVTLATDTDVQGNYILTEEEPDEHGSYTITTGSLQIQRAELIVMPKHQVKAVGVVNDPLLAADIEGWRNGDDPTEDTTLVSTETSEDEKTVTRTYQRGEGDAAETFNVISNISEDKTVTWTYQRGGKTVLTFTLKRDPGEDEGEYNVIADGDPAQFNYAVSYELGTFNILSILDIDVTQPLTDNADAGANPVYHYKATLNLDGTGLDEYNKNGFESVDGVPTLSFVLPDDGAEMRTLKVPAGARLTVEQSDEHKEDYTTAIKIDGSPYTNPDSALTCILASVDTYHELAFAHNRISLPVEARASEDQAEADAKILPGRKGAMGIPRDADGNPSVSGRTIDLDFAEEMHSKIGYELPTDKYYAYSHAALYTAPASGSGALRETNIAAVRYGRDTGEDGTEAYKWQYRIEGREEFIDVPADTKLVLFYLPKYVCKINEEKFDRLTDAVDYAENNGGTAKIEMLIGEYSIRTASDAVTIPADCNITITTAETEYEGTGTAVIGRGAGLTGGHLFDNKGTLTFDNIILDGKNVRAADATVLNEATLTITENASLRNAVGNNGGAIYAKTGTVTVSGTLSGNTAAYGGAIYVKDGTVKVTKTETGTGTLSGNTATYGGAVYVNDGNVELGGSLTGNKADAGNGGAVYINKGTVELTKSGSLTKNEAANGGAVYQNGGTLTVSGSMAENTASSNGGGVYLNSGTLKVESQGSLSGNTASANGGGVYQANGTLDNEGAISGNSAANGGGIYRVNGTLTVGGTLSGNTANENGGGFYSVGGTVNVNAAISGNTATGNGGAAYVGSAALHLNGGSVTGNNAENNGGAFYVLNTTTVIGTDNSAAELSSNTAAVNGGALFMEGGSLHIHNANSTLSTNKAANGGGIYATSGAITVNNGTLSGNEAQTSGGAVYASSASVKIEGGTLTGNKANAGNGGAIFDESGAVTVSGGTLSGNSAAANGGAIYATSGTVNYTGGSINGGNSAVNGAAIFAGSGIANISASITGNTATNGGAVGVGSTSARLNFKGNAEVNNNTMDDAQSNVYLDVDSELVINADSLNNGKKIGVYVPGEVDSDQVVKHGDVTGYFGAYVSAGTLANIPKVFKSDRFSDLKVAYENNRMYWISNLSYDIYYLKDYTSQFPPTSNYTASPSKKVCSGKTYAPRTRQSDIYDLVMAMKLYEAHNGDFTSNVGSNYASTAVYAYTFSDKAMSVFTDYLKSVEWDAVARKWKYTTQSGTEITNTSKLVIFYSAPAYLTIVNNNTSGLELDISELTVLNQNAAQGLYGFVTAKNGATVTTLRTITEDDMKLAAGDSIKLMLPGAQGQSFTIRGEFVGSGEGEIKYTFNGGAEQTISGTTVDLSSYSLNTNDEAAELVFGDALPICKIGNEPFSTLKAAMAYAVAQKAATGSNTYKIEMLVDYLVPKDDVLAIPAGYNITFTTADRDAETLPYTGNGTRATLSRDTGNSGSSVSATNSILTVDNLAFDGRSLTAGGKGGAISTTNCATVTITNSEFKGYRADNGGAIYVENQNAGSSLTVEHCDFYNCQTNASVDKAGGGALWTTARELYVRNCTFDFCACLQGKAQAGSVFHNIQANWFTDSKTVISDCTFSNSYAVGGSGGTVESDAYDVTIERCSFEGSYTNKNGGSGGAINTYANNEASTSKYCIMRVIDCTFDNCSAKNGAAMGGAVRCSTHDLILRGCVFRNTQGVTGGAVAMTNSNAKKVEIYGCVFDNCTATGNGGAVSAPVGTLIVGVEDTGAEDYRSTYLDNTEKDGYNHFTDCAANRGGGIDNAKNDASVTMENVHFTRCVAKTSGGGALYTQAKTLSITGDANTFTDCTGYGSGGAVYQNRNVDGSKVELENCVFTGCEAFNDGNGGGMYANARTLTINYDTANNSAIEGAEGSFVNCTAANAGGGLYHDYTGTVTIANCGFVGCKAKAANGGGLYTTAHTLKIIGEGSKFQNCTAQTDGGGLYQNRDAVGSTFTFKDGSFENCTATGSYGGAIYTKVKGNATLENCTVKDSTAKAQGGGIYFGNGNTASFDGCTVTGNSVTNSDSKGGGVYVPGGTTTFMDSTVSDCEAAYGGGWYQNNGTLYILGGSISGSAVNGGGLYMNDANTKVYQYGGNMGGTATANGGGVFKNNGTYTIGDATYAGTVYSGASIGSLSADGNGNPVYSATAVNGGSIYQNSGTVSLTAGSSVVGQAAGNGGGIWNKGTVNHNGGDVTGSAVNGGGVWQTDTSNGKYYLNGGTVTGAATENGGAVYQGGNIFNINNNATVGRRIAIDGEGNETIAADSSAKNGGGVYIAAGTVNLNASGSIAGASASENGGGVYHAGGTFTFSGGSIIQNGATVNGGGVYHAGGAFSMTNAGAVIGGSEENANTANVGAGVFVADGQAATFNGSTVTYNHALTAGGGIAVGGPDAALTFQNAATVRNNTMGSQNTECNVYLDQDRNTIIKNNALNANAYIGVYASDDQDAGHGVQGMPFATWNTGNNNDKNLNVYHNDRRPYLYGMKGSTNNEVIWPEFVCKITDGEGNLLYKDENGTPAVYSELENRADGKNNSAGAFTVLNVADTPALYQKDAEGNYTLYNSDGTGEYQVQMLVPNYEMGRTRQIKLESAVAQKVTLTTASTTEDECGFKYTGDARFSATITRTAATSCMIFVGSYNNWELTLGNITLDGGNYSCTEAGAILRVVGNGKATLDAGAVLQNGKTNNSAGGAVYVDDTGVFTMNAGSSITDCSAGTSNGGGVYINKGAFTMNAGSSITGCSAANGGGVYLNENTASFTMQGGEITGNSATSTGGGISHNKDKEVKVYFSGYCTVTGNTLNSTTRCNVQLNRDTNAIIYADGLDSRSEIGVYTADGNIYNNHGKENTPFGTRQLEEDNFYCFVNDRHTYLRGFRSATESNTQIYWEYRPLLTVTKLVDSDWIDDQTKAEFEFKVQLLNTTFSRNTKYGDMVFTREGVATVKLKAGQSATGIFTADLDKVSYTVTEVLSETQQEGYTTAATKDGEAYSFDPEKPMTVIGRLGENIGSAEPEKATSLSDVVFTNTRVTGELTVTKKVRSSLEEDKAESFSFRLTLDPNAKEKISKPYSTVRKDSEGRETSGTLSFTEGAAEFVLKDGESITVLGLPTDMPYKVQELLTDSQKGQVRTFAQKDAGEESYSPDASLTGKIGEYKKTVTEEGVEKEIYTSDIVFTNNFLEIVCKITDRSRKLLYYRDSNGPLQPAIFSHLEDAFAAYNAGGFRTRNNGSATAARIEMVVPEYTMEGTATLNSGKSVTLSTALWNDEDFPYNNSVDDGNGVSTVFRGFTDGSMIVGKGALILNKITLDGASDAEEPITGIADGGIIQMAGAARLTLNDSATLRNSVVTGSEEPEGAAGNGGAIWLASGASLIMNGTVENCSAENGGGVYASDGFTTMTLTGQISKCKARSGDGGAICAGTGTSVSLNAGTSLTGNEAANNGGAVRSGANLILRGTVGGTESGQGNKAGGEGGGICMGSNTIFTMYAGSEISGNTALNGGGLSTHFTTRIAGGRFTNNTAKANEGEGGLGGAVYITENAAVTVSGTAAFTGNRAAIGGAVYDRGSVSMTGGSMTGNIAEGKGGAVYVADTPAEEDGSVTGHSFSMSGGSINGGNKSPEGAVSTDAHAELYFSGNCDISGNTDLSGDTPMNVYLGYDSNGIIRTTGLGTSANVGVYVADGEPETDDPTDPDYREDHSDHPIYADHGVAGRNFGTYTGSNISRAKLDKFHNDRDTGLDGMNGEQIEASEYYYVAWHGKGLQLKVTQYLPKLDENGEAELDEEGRPIFLEPPVPVQNAIFTLTNIPEATEENPGVPVWRGRSGTDGRVTIPWDGDEKEIDFMKEGGAASFKPYTIYRLDQTDADSKTVRPAGHWTVTIARDNSVTWTVIPSEEENVDRIFSIVPMEKSVLGEIFGLNNDVKPTMTYNANGGRLKDKRPERTDSVAFTTSEVKHDYTINETDPTWESHVFKQWATMPNKPEVEVETEGKTEEEIEIEKEAMRKALGYYEYTKENTITFFRGTDTDIPAEKYADNKSRGNMTLYAQWEPVVCKITTYRGGPVVFEKDGLYPAAYGTLKEGFAALNSKTFCTDPSNPDRTEIRRAATLYLEMLVPEYTMTESVENDKMGYVVLTTALTTDTDGYPYSGDPGTECTIYRGDCSSTMIVNKRNLTLREITLDGRMPRKDMYGNVIDYTRVTAICDGGIIYNSTSSALTIVNATLQHSDVEGNGGAVNLAARSSLTMSGGTIRDCSAIGYGTATGLGGAVHVEATATATVRGGTINGNSAELGAGIYLTEGSRLNLSGDPNFGGTDRKGGNGTDKDDLKGTDGNFIRQGYAAEANEKNGGKDYTRIRQDIYIEGYADTDPAQSLAVAGNLTSGDGTIWVWADNVNHYEMLKQFAVYTGSGTPTDDTMKVFRNAQPDSFTNCGGDYLTGQKGEQENWIYWTGGFDVVLRKIDSFGRDMNGATFTLYKSNDARLPTTEAYQRSVNGTMQDITAVSRVIEPDNAVTIRIKNGDNAESRMVYGNALVVFEKIPVGTYYVRETSVSINGEDRTADYRTVEDQYKLVIDKSGWYTLSVPIYNTNGTITWLPAESLQTAPTTLFVRGTDNKYTKPTAAVGAGADTLAVYTLLNVPKTERKVILRKVIENSYDYEPLGGAQFTITYADRRTVVRLKDAITGSIETLENLRSLDTGVFWIGKLPYGTYYLHETAPVDRWFELTVNEKGYGYELTNKNTTNELYAEKAVP